MVGYLLENDNRDTACVMPVKEYVDLYSKPYDLVLESGKVNKFILVENLRPKIDTV